MTRQIIRIFLAIMALSAVSVLSASPRVIPISPAEYRAANINWVADRDDHGFTYFANDMGLLEFDGLRWRLYPLPKGSVVRSVAALSHETIFTGSFEEFGRWDRDESGRLHYTSLVPDDRMQRPRNSDIWKIYITPKGVVFQSFQDLYFYDYTTVRKLDSGRGMNMLFLLRAEKEMWIQQMGGALYRFDGKDIQLIPGSEFFGSTTVRVLLDLPEEDKLLTGTGTMGLWTYDGKRFTEWSPELSALMKRYELNCGIRSSRGTYLFGTLLGGIYEVDAQGRILHHLSTGNLMLDNSIMSLMEDDSHNVWALTDRGLSYLIYEENTNYCTTPQWPYGSVYDAVLWEGKLFIGTNQGVFYTTLDRLDSPNFPDEFRPVTGIQGQVWSLCVLDGRLWCCQNNGIIEIGRNLSARRASDMGGYRLARTHLNGRDVTLYASYYCLRLLDMVSGKTTVIDDIPESFYNVEVDHMQNLWLEHPAKGVYKCRLNDDMGSVRDIKFYGGDSGDGLPYKLQVFRVGGRAVLMGGDRFFTYNNIRDRIEPDSLLDACFAGTHGLRRVVPMGNNRFWVLTQAGAYKLHYDGYNATLTPCREIPQGRLVYNYENVAMLDDSTSLFCCDNGFIVYREHAASEREYHPAVPTIESVGAGRETGIVSYFTANTPARIPYNENSMHFRFAARNAFADQLSFRYRVQGVDTEWHEGNNTGEAVYARLPKGHYAFEVEAEDRFGNTSEPALMEFDILAPWYTSGWAYAGYTLLTVLLLYGTWLVIMHRYRTYYLRKVRHREIISLRTANKELSQEIEFRDAEIFSQSSMLVAKNEQIAHIRDMIEDFTHKQGNKALTPLYYKINTFITNNLDPENDWKLFLIRFEQKHAGFFRTLKERYPDLTSNDLRLCACLRFNLDTKDIASLMNLTVRAVENSRYRLRKKLGLQPTQNLNEFLMEIEPENDAERVENGNISKY